MDKKKINLDFECSELEFKIEPFAFEEKNNIFCELKFYFQTNPTHMIELLKMYSKVSEIQKHHRAEDEHGDPYYQTDIWNLKLDFLRFEKDDE